MVKMEQMRNELTDKLREALQQAIAGHKDREVMRTAKLISELEKQQLVPHHT